MGDPVRVGPAVDGWPERIWPRRHAGPLAAVMRELIDWLVVQGYAPTTQRNQIRATARLGSWLDSEGLALGDVDAAGVTRLVGQDNERHPEHRSANENVSAVLRFLSETGHLKPSRVAEPRLRPSQACLAQWLRFLEVEQGHGASWVDKARRFGERFLTLVEDEVGDLHWERVDVVMVNEFLVSAVAGYSSSTAQGTAALLRGLLIWAASSGLVRAGIAEGVLSPRRVRTGLPKGLCASEVEALKSVVDLDSRTGRRDLAIIVMVASPGPAGWGGRRFEAGRPHLAGTIAAGGRQGRPCPGPTDARRCW